MPEVCSDDPEFRQDPGSFWGHLGQTEDGRHTPVRPTKTRNPSVVEANRKSFRPAGRMLISLTP